MEKRPQLDILLCAPRGFCAGVDRAIQIVELALEKYGAPVYVRHAIVHNKYVVDGLRDKGAVFVEELSEIPETDAPVVFSAHGVPKSVPADAKSRNMFFLDATCPRWMATRQFMWRPALASSRLTRAAMDSDMRGSGAPLTGAGPMAPVTALRVRNCSISPSATAWTSTIWRPRSSSARAVQPWPKP